MQKVKEGYNKGKILCIGGTVVCDNEESAIKFEKEYYESVGETYEGPQWLSKDLQGLKIKEE